MMEVENNVAERFEGQYDDLPDEHNMSNNKEAEMLDDDPEEQGIPANGLGLPAGNRLIKKAKRQSKANSLSEDGTPMIAPSPGLVKLNSKSAKNLRRSRASGRGLPKKGGAGKGGWGKLGDEIELPWVDPNDPNYDSDGTDPVEGGVKPSAKKTIRLNALVPELNEEDIRKTMTPVLKEYFDNGDPDEVIASVEEMLLNIGGRRWMIPAMAIELSLDHKPSHREMTSVLLSDMYLKVISQNDIGTALDTLLRQLSDLILDTPDAPILVGNFIARCIADDCIPPKFLRSYKGKVEEPQAKKALFRADTLLGMKHGLVRLDNVWGVGGGIRPVKYLKKKIVLLLKEYLCSCDVAEASRCLLDLEVPHFHHELVYEAILMVIESMHEKTDEAMCKLLSSLFRSFVITIDQMRAGFQRIYDTIADICIDVPQAYLVLERFVLRSNQAGIIDDDFVKKMPCRGRKRFVSEGDGGLIKTSMW